MQKGWKATGLLKPLWKSYPGGRDALAKSVSSHGPTLSAINTGRQSLAEDLGRRLAKELHVSLAELGAPEDVADDRDSRKIRDRLAKLENDGLTLDDLQPLLRVVQLLAAGKRAEAQRALSEAGLTAQ